MFSLLIPPSEPWFFKTEVPDNPHLQAMFKDKIVSISTNSASGPFSWVIKRLSFGTTKNLCLKGGAKS